MVTALVTHVREMMEIAGPVAALVFTGVALHVDARVRRAETILEITKQHRDLWTYFYDRPNLAGLLEPGRDMNARPLATEEAHFVSFFFNHLRAAYFAEKAKIFVHPAGIRDDLREVLSFPAFIAAWDLQKKSHEPEFVAFIDEQLGGR